MNIFYINKTFSFKFKKFFMKLQDNLIIKDSKTGKDLDKFIFKSENKNFFSSSKVINLEKNQ